MTNYSSPLEEMDQQPQQQPRMLPTADHNRNLLPAEQDGARSSEEQSARGPPKKCTMLFGNSGGHRGAGVRLCIPISEVRSLAARPEKTHTTLSLAIATSEFRTFLRNSDATWVPELCY